MTAPNEMTEDEIVAHGVSITAARTDDEFVNALAAYFKEVVARETNPYNKIALFVNDMLEAHAETYVRDDVRILGGHVTRVEVELGVESHLGSFGYVRSALVPACSCGWSSPPYYWSNMPSGVSELRAREKAEGQCAEHRFRVLLRKCQDGASS